MKVGVLGGSFDPIHIGHLVIAQEAFWQCGLDTVLFMVTSHPPHKSEPVAGPEDRYRMVELAVADHPAFQPSRLEIERGGSSYTAETLKQLHAMQPEASFHLIVGADSVLDLSAWKNPGEVLGLARLVVLPRPGFDLEKMEKSLRGRVHLLDAPTLAISSTMLRGRIRDARPVRYLVPDAVEKHIRERGLYCR